MEVTGVKLEQLRGKHRSTNISTWVWSGQMGRELEFTISIYGEGSTASEREILDGWTPEIGMDHVESEEHLFLAKVIMEALKK